jgi:hypothetical protein
VSRKRQQDTGASAPAVPRISGYRVTGEPHYFDRLYQVGEIVEPSVVDAYAPGEPGPLLQPEFEA